MDRPDRLEEEYYSRDRDRERDRDRDRDRYAPRYGRDRGERDREREYRDYHEGYGAGGGGEYGGAGATGAAPAYGHDYTRDAYRGGANLEDDRRRATDRDLPDDYAASRRALNAV